MEVFGLEVDDASVVVPGDIPAISVPAGIGIIISLNFHTESKTDYSKRNEFGACILDSFGDRHWVLSPMPLLPIPIWHPGTASCSSLPIASAGTAPTSGKLLSILSLNKCIPLACPPSVPTLPWAQMVPVAKLWGFGVHIHGGPPIF